MRPVLLALLTGGSFVASAAVILGRLNIWTPLLFILLIPGIEAGAWAPDSGFNPEGDTHPWGPISTTIMYIVNVAIYSALVFAIHGISRKAGRSTATF